MRIAVLSLTRDRLSYTQHCFASLWRYAGCAFDHYVLDNGSTDGTVEWLKDEFQSDRIAFLALEPENIGLTPGLNRLLDELYSDYDVIVRFDNDCEVTHRDTLKTVCEVALQYDAIIAPRVLGLENPPPSLGSRMAGEHLIDLAPVLGGIFMAIPAFIFTEYGFRYDENAHPHSGDEAVVPWYWARDGACGYLEGFSVNHYETTRGQRERYPDYFDRKDAEWSSTSMTSMSPITS